MPIFNIPAANIPYERRKTIINKNMISNLNSNLNNINAINTINTINTINALNTINTFNTINSINNSKNNYQFELGDIFRQIKSESKSSNNSIDSYQSIKLLTLYIRRNRNNMDETIKKISDLFEAHNDLSDQIIIYIIELVLNLITENSQIINFLNRILPKLINILTQKNKDLTSIELINNELGKLIKIGGVYTRKIIEINFEKILMKFVNENRNFKYENTKFAYLQFLCVIIQNAPLVAFGKFSPPNSFINLFMKILDNFKDPKIEIRITTGELIGRFMNLLANRDKNIKEYYIKTIYKYVFNEYEKHIKDNNDIPNNSNLFSGLITILQKIYIAFPSFLKSPSIYMNLLKNIIKSKNSKNTSLKIEFIKFIPQLYQINREIFIEKYLKLFFDYFNDLLNIKTNPDIRNALFMTLGTFSLLLKKNNFVLTLEPLLNLIGTLLIDKKIFDKEIFKCLSDLIRNKENLYSNLIISKLDLNFLLSKLFKTKISSYKIEFLNSIMKSFNYNSKEHLSTVITSLNVISIILCDEDFELTYFYNSYTKLISEKSNEEIDKILVSNKKYIKKYISQKNENFESGSDLNLIKVSNKNNTIDNKKDFGVYSKCKCLNEPKLINCALSLFSRIENDYFFKDMFIFYKEKILPFLFFINNSKVIKKILDIMLCEFIKIYDSDKNLSEYLIKSILDTLKNFIFTYKDHYLVIYAFNILQKKTIFLDLLLENKQIFFNKVFGMLSSNNVNDDIKEKIIQTIGLLAMRSNDKNYFIIVIRKNINSLLFCIQNNEDIIQKENNVLLLLYYSMYVKFLFDFSLIEKIMEINIDILLGNEYQGILSMNILKIFCELLNTDIINEQFVKINNDKFNEYFQLLLIICIIDIKEGGINTKKTETSLRTLYQIIKVKRIDIYKSFSPQFSTKMKNNLTNSSIFKDRTENENSINSLDELLTNERGEKINLIEILLQNVIKGATDECLTIIMNIFGLCGAMEPSKMERYFSAQGLSIYHLEGNLREEDSIDDNEFKIISYKKNKIINKNDKNLNEIDLASIDPSTSKAVLSLMRILKESSQQEVSCQIISFLSSIIKALTINEANLIDIILPTIIEVIPQFEINYQKNIFDNINLIINNFKNKIKFYLDEIIQLIINYIMNENYLNIICKMLNKLFTYFVYEMEIYYPLLIPIFLNLIKQNTNESNLLIELFVLIAENKNISSYLNIMLDELSVVYLDNMDSFILKNLINFFSKIVKLENTSMFYSTIINILLQKLIIIDKSCPNDINKLTREKKLDYIFKGNPKSKLNLSILSETINIFKIMNCYNRKHFIEYLPMIIDTLKETNFLYFGDVKTSIRYSLLEYLDYKFSTKNELIDKLLTQYCAINCIRGFYPFERKNSNNVNKKIVTNINRINNNINNNNINNNNIIININNNDIIRTNPNNNSSINKYLLSQSSKNRNSQIDNELIIKIFDNSNCIVEEDWHDWFKSSSKILFEQSPSYILYNCNLLSDYYFPLILELYNYGFFTVYINNNDKNKMILAKGLISALENPKTPNDILLTILNLIEFIERRNVNLCYIDYNQFGKVAYKCRAFAKALYYKENDFLLKNDFEEFEDLLELYYEVKQQESAKGLLEIVNKNFEKNKENTDIKDKNCSNTINDNLINLNINENNKYSWYIKIHDYNKALKLIDQKLSQKDSREQIENLKKNRIICLNGLCDWERLISEENNINNNDYIYDEINNNTINSNSNKNNKKNIDETQKIIEEELILSKACMNLNQWTQLKNHFYKIYSLFKCDYNEEEQNIINENDNDNFNIGKKSDINDDEKSENEINLFLKKHGLSRNTGSLDNEVIENISFNKHLFMNNNNNETRKKSNFFGKSSIILSKDTNYKTNPMSLENQNYNIIPNESIINNININNNINNIDINNYSNEQLEFISYDKIINNNSIFSFIDNSPENLFDLNLYSSIINIYDGKYENALRFIFSAKKLILTDIKSLLAESYNRGYELLIKNQLLCLLEQIIEYKQLHDNDENYLNQMVNFWDQGLNMVGKEDPSIYEKFLSLRALILPIQKEFDNYMNLAKIYRKLGMYTQSEKILNRIQNKLNLNNIEYLNNDYHNVLLSDENKIRINLSLNQCLFESGKIREALDKSEYLVELLNDAENKNKILNIRNNSNDNGKNVIILEEDGFLLEEYGDLSKINDKIKSKIYGNFAIYKLSSFDFEKNNLKYIIKKSNISLIKNKHSQNLEEIGRRTVLIHSPNINKKIIGKNINNILMIPEDEDEENDEDNLTLINNNLMMATKYNNKSFKLWHSYAMFNYKFYISLLKCKNILELNIDNNNINYNFNDCEIEFAINAVNGFKNSLCIGGKNKNKTFQDLLRLLDIFFNSGSKNKELLSLINSCFNEIEIDAFLNVIPQLLCRFNINENNILSILILLLIKIGKAYPRAIIFHLIVMKYSNSRKRISVANQILNAISKNNNINNKLVEESEIFIKELNNCAILLHEQWSEAIEETSKMYYNKDYINTVKHLIKLHKKMHKKPENNYEIHFYQKYGTDIFQAENYIQEYIDNNYIESLNEAWDCYLRLYRNIADSFKKFEQISLEYISPKLSNLENSNISLPGSYIPIPSSDDLVLRNDKQDQNEFIGVRIKKMGKILKIFNTKQHPRQLSMVGTDDKEYLFLLKGHEDLHQDERAMQLFNLVNTILSNNKLTSNKNLFIDTYSVFPLSHSTGIIGWVPNCDTLHQLIKEQREVTNTIPNIEHRKMFKICSKYESCNFLYKVEIFKDSIKDLPGLELNNIIWIKSKNCETWLTRRTNYSRSLAVMSMVGYILGLGDRHPSNLMMSRKTGKIIHIDFGDCFEIAMKRDKFPEKVPFRLTRMLVKALEVSGVEGTFRIICEKVMELMRENKDSLLAILGSFLYDPLISFRLMIPMIIRQKKLQSNNLKNKKIKKKQNNRFINNFNNKSQFINNLSSSAKIKNNALLKLDEIFNENENNNYINENNNKNNRNNINNINLMNENNENIDNNDYINMQKINKKDEKIEEIDEEKEKNEKKRMEIDERHIFNIYEENDEIESEDLNKIAKIVLDRISNKLSGTEFYPEIIYDIKSQVDKLINDAISYENLAQSYLGWCPFW